MVQLASFLFILMTVIYHSVSSSFVLSDFQQQALIEHNRERELHCTPAMILNSTINAIAQSYAEYLAESDKFEHSGAPRLGENLWAVSDPNGIESILGSRPSASWYDEISLYNYNAPGYTDSTGHFTQNVWKSSTQLGIGIAFSSDRKGATVVANYYPAGNVRGGYPENVLPLCKSSATNSFVIVRVFSYDGISWMMIVVGALVYQFLQN